jgi:hypothetical protein
MKGLGLYIKERIVVKSRSTDSEDVKSRSCSRDRSSRSRRGRRSRRCRISRRSSRCRRSRRRKGAGVSVIRVVRANAAAVI